MVSIEKRGNKLNESHAKSNWMIYFLILGSIFTWSYSMIKSPQQMGDFGLIHSLSYSYFISMALLLGSFILALRSTEDRRIFFAIILILILIIFLTPSIIEGTSRFRFSYKVYGFAEYIIRNGNFNPNAIWYHDWPGSFLWISMLSDIIKQNDDFLILMYFPFIIQILYLFPLYIFLKSLFQNDKKIWISIWIFYIINFINQDYMSPQAFAYLYYLIMLSIIVKLANIGTIDRSGTIDRNGTIDSNNTNYNNINYSNNISYKFTSVILISGLTITHMLTPMIVLSIIFFSALFSPSSIKKNLFKFTLVLTIIMTVWVIYGAQQYLNWHLLDFFQNTFGGLDSYSQNIQQRVSGSPAHLIVSELMIGTTLISGVFAIIGIILSFYRKDKISKLNIKLVSMIIAIMVLAKSPYGGEMIMRIFLFILPFVSFFIAQIYVSKAKIILTVFLIVMTPLNLVTHYGNEKYDYVSKAELNSFDFYYKNVDNKNVTGGYPITYYKFAEKFNYVQFKEFKDLKWDGTKYTTETGDKNNMMVSRGDKEQLAIFSDDVTFINEFENNLMNSNNYVKVYANSDVNLYNIRSR